MRSAGISASSTPRTSRPTSPHTRALPRILCLHGGGTSALIFKIQLRNITHALGPYFNFIFLDAPFISSAGPGVLPIFAELAPYYRWMPAEDYTSRGVEKGIKEQEDAAKRTREKILRAMREDTEAGNTGDVVGVMGFSQGGRMTAGLLADQSEENVFPGLPQFQFGVMLCASYPPYSTSNASKAPSDWSGPKDHHGIMDPPLPEEVLTVPSVQVRGLLDPHLEKGRRLGKYFGGELKEEREFEMGHNLPQASGDTTSGGLVSTHEIRDAILKIWDQCRSGAG